MSIPSLDVLLEMLQKLGAQRVLCKRLAENDNSKQQVYLGHGFDALNVIPFGEVKSDSSKKQPIMKAAVLLNWLDDGGHIAPATGAQLVLYPQYPEVRMSGFLRGCATAPNDLMRPVPKASRRFSNGADGRLLFLAILPSREIVAYLAPAGSAIAGDFDARDGRTPFVAVGVFLDVPLPKVGDARALLLDRLRQIHAEGWHASCRLHADGTRHPYAARNGGGYTLEALFDIIPNGRAEPDFHGWELKACGSDRVTLMTPEPDSGYYGREGVEAFVRRYGHVADGDTLYFTGMHRAGVACTSTGQELTVRGFDASTAKIVDVDGGLYLVGEGGEDSAGWSFRRLLEHWGRKHASAAYVPYEARDTGGPEYRYTSPAMLGEGTSFEKFLKALVSGLVVYDPGPKVMAASTVKPKTKARSQFRIGRKNLGELYVRFTPEPIDQDAG